MDGWWSPHYEAVPEREAAASVWRRYRAADKPMERAAEPEPSQTEQADQKNCWERVRTLIGSGRSMICFRGEKRGRVHRVPHSRLYPIPGMTSLNFSNPWPPCARVFPWSICLRFILQNGQNAKEPFTTVTPPEECLGLGTWDVGVGVQNVHL